MSKIAEVFAGKINQVSNTSLKKFLLDHLNPEAKTQAELLCKKFPSTRKAPTKGRAALLIDKELSYQNVLSFVFAYAPEEVCLQAVDVLLKMDNQEMVDLLSAFCTHPADSSLNERVMHTLMHFAPSTARKKLLATIKSLPMDAVVTLLFGKFYLSRYFTVFMELLNPEDKESLDSFLSILHDYAQDEGKRGKLFDLFQTDPFPSRAYTALIDLCKLPLTEDQAWQVLSLLEMYEKDNLTKLIAGIRGQFNLLHIVFERYSEKVVAKLLTILKKLPPNELQALLTAQASFNQHQTPLAIALARKECPAIACQVIDFLNQNETLKSLLNDTSIQQSYSPLHHAVLQQNISAVAHYLKQPAATDPKSIAKLQDLYGLAEEKNHFDIVYLLKIHQAFDKNDTAALDDFIKNADNHLIKAWAFALNKTRQNTRSFIGLQTTFEQIQPHPLHKTLAEYCVKEKDILHYYLLLTSKLLATSNESSLELAVGTLIEESLRELTTQTNSVLIDGLQLKLITLFFTLPQTIQIKYINQLNLDSQQKIQWATVLFRGLTQPAVFSSLSLKEHEFFLETLRQISGEHNLHLKLAGYYLLHAPLHHLPAPLLLTLTELATLPQLKDCLKNKLNPLLILLTLQKTLKTETPDETLVTELYQQLEQELTLIKQNKSPLREEEIRLLLNLAQHPKLKLFIQKHLGERLDSLVEKAFVHYNLNNVLLPQSLLREQIISRAATLKMAMAVGNYTAYVALFTVTTPEETSALLAGLHPLLDRTNVDDGRSKDNEGELHEALLQLQNKRHRLQFVPLIEQLNLLLQSLPPERVLNDFKENLTLLRNDLLVRQKQPYSSTFDPTLQSLLKATSDSFSTLGDRGPELVKNSPWPIANFAELLAEIQRVGRDLKKLKGSETNTAEEQQYFLPKFRQTVIQGLMNNAQIEKQLSSLFYWFFMDHRFHSDDLMHEQILTLHKKINPKAWQPIQQQLDQFLLLHRATATILLDLKKLSLKANPLSVGTLLAYFEQIPVASLEQFKEFCALCHNRQMMGLIDYVIEAKIMELPFNAEEAPDLAKSHSSVNLWLDDSLDYFKKQTSRALSCKALIMGFDWQHPLLELKRLNQLISENAVSLDAKTLTHFISTATAFLDEPENDPQALILSLNELVNQQHVVAVADMVNLLPEKTMNTLTHYCLRSLNGSTPQISQACRNLMTLLCQCASQSEKNLEIIKTNLGRQDLSLLGDEQLVKMANNILKQQSDDLSTATLNGVWIQRLLMSPQFVAASTPEAMRALVERYRFLSLTLKQAEFEQLNRHIQGQMEFFKHHTDNLAQVDSQLNNALTRRANLLEKRQRLLQFRADDSIRALLMQLEDSCFAMRKDNPGQANAALRVLYTHYNNNLSSLRSDWLFKVADFVYVQSTENKGDLELAQSTFLSWLQQYLPHQNFEQKELARKQSVLLYDVTGKEIGFINEANHAMTFVEDVPCPLIELRGYSAGMQVYDSHRYTLGFLLPSGEVKRVNIFQKKTSALLLAQVPIEQLSASTATTELLLADIINEEMLEALYTESSSEKLLWAKNQVETYAAKVNKPLPYSLFELVVQQHKPANVYPLLASMPCNRNSQSLFQAILEYDATREQLFSAEFKPAFEAYLNKYNPADILSDFIAKHHSQPYFSAGLKAFADYASTHNCRDILIQALGHLQEKKNKELEKEWDAILAALIGNEGNAKIIWQNFLDANINSPLSTIDRSLSELAIFFERKHCTPVIQAVNQLKTVNLSSSYQYRLMLLILQQQRHEFFQRVELRYSPHHWTNEELSSYSLFVKRHFGTATPLDEEKVIAKELLGELVFRCANSGNTSLFYNQNQFDKKLASLHFERSYLNAIAARDFIPAAVKNKLQALADTLKSWFDGDKAQQKQKTIEELKANKAIIDWKKINEQTWAMTNSVKMLPLISAYLANYSGASKPLKALLDDYCRIPDADLQSLSKVMLNLPARNVSPCIFQTLEAHFTTQPSQMDYTLFSDMATYHAQTHLKHKSPSPKQCQEALIDHFGKQKKYALVAQACQLYEDNQEKNAKVEKIHLQAVVEGELSAHMGTWYFKFWQMIKRWWHYGFNNSKTTSPSVVFCDKESDYTSPVVVPPKVTTPELNGALIQTQMEMHKKITNLKQRYEVFVAQQSKIETETLLPPIANLNELFFYTGSHSKVDLSQPILPEVMAF